MNTSENRGVELGCRELRTDLDGPSTGFVGYGVHGNAAIGVVQKISELPRSIKE